MIRLLLVALLSGSAANAAELQLQSTYVWEHQDDAFGGVSGIWVSEKGDALVAVTDRGHFVEADIQRSNGNISDVAVRNFDALKGRDGLPLSGILVDAEGLAIAGDGTRFVSFEGNPRVWRYSSFASRPQWTHKWNRFWNLQRNSGLEALAIDDNGTLYAVPERSGRWERPFPVYRYDGKSWDDRLNLPRSEKFLVVGADFGPDGKFYLLEREFNWLGGFKSRIRRFTLADAGFENEETLLQSDWTEYDNLEGIAVWEDGNGATIITLVSDDNFSVFQSTTLVEFLVID